MRGAVAKRLRREAVELATKPKTAGYLGLKNKTVWKNEDGKPVYNKILGTIINHPESIRAKYQVLKRNYKKKD